MTAAGGIDPMYLSIFIIPHHFSMMPYFISALAGYVFVNVPAIRGLHSRFDDVLGHVRHYERGLLSRHLVEAGLDVLSVRWWALTMIPVIYVRALLVNFFTDADKILDVGFKPPGRLTSALRYPGSVRLRPGHVDLPLPECLLAVARKADGPRPSGSYSAP